MTLQEAIRRRYGEVGEIRHWSGRSPETIQPPVITEPPSWLKDGARLQYSPTGSIVQVTAVSNSVCVVKGLQYSWSVDTSILARYWRPL